MNHQLWTAAGARVLAAAFVIAGVAACGEKAAQREAREANTPSPSAVVIGQAPAEPAAQPSGDTPQTTPPAGARGEVSKAEDSVARPKEGDNHSHSTVAPVTPQKAEGASAINMERKPE